jgi:hypothetical protein
VAVGDFNGDGAPDLVTVNISLTEGVSVLLNTTLPWASPQAVATSKGQPLLITLTGAAPNNVPVTFAITASPAHGTLSGFNATAGQVTYTPNASYVGPDSFQFTVTDTRTHFTSADAVVNITVSAGPVANPQSVTVPQGQPMAITLTGSAPNGDLPSFALASQPTHGTLSGFIGTTGQVTYTPAAGNTGSDSFQFTVTDTATNQTSAAATVSVTVAAPGPVANPQSLTLGQGLSRAVTLTGSAPNGDSITYQVASGPAHGTLGGTAPNLTYIPAAGFAGADSFTFTLTDTATGMVSSPATVALTVVPPPAATAQALTVAESTAKNVTLAGTAPNGDPFTFIVASNPSHGTLSEFDGSTGAVTYTPASGYTGSDSFQFKVSDTATNLSSSAATVSITVAPLPVANPQSVSASAGRPAVFMLSGSAPAGHAYTFALASSPAHGTIGSFNSSTGQFTYTSNPSYAGPDNFTFKVKDVVTGLSSSPATVSITVTASPFAVAQFGNQGVWQFNPSSGTWTQLTPASASLLATDRVGTSPRNSPATASGCTPAPPVGSRSTRSTCRCWP